MRHSGHHHPTAADRRAAVINASVCPRPRKCWLSSPVGQMRMRLILGMKRLQFTVMCDHAPEAA